MAHKSFAFALIIGLAALPLACGDDDDDTGGTAGSGGSAGKGGTSSTAGKGGTSGTAGKGGTSGTAGKGGTGTAGTTPNDGGEGGTGNTGTNGGEAGMAGQPAGGADAGGEGGGPSGGGAGGEGGAGDPAAAARVAKCQTIVNMEIYPGYDITATKGQCEDRSQVWVNGFNPATDPVQKGFCYTEGFSADCLGHIDAVLDCALSNPALDPTYFYCSEDTGDFAGHIAIDLAVGDACPDEWFALQDCRAAQD
jgi:hypothetical protein